MNGLTIVAVVVVLAAQSYRIWRLRVRLDETRNLTADTLEAHTTVLMRFQGRLNAVEYPRYLGTEIGSESECQTPEDVHYQHPRRGQESAQQQAGFYVPLPRPETSPFFTQSPPE